MSDEQKKASLVALAVHYPKAKRTPEEQGLWLSHYLEDLRPHTPEAVEFACRAWRQSEARSFPKVGELLPLVRKHAPQTTQRLGAWAELSNDEVDALPLVERIRYHEIAANQAKVEAGPQMINRRPAKPEEMGDKWRRGRERASNHLAEVSRLKVILADHRERHA